MDIFFALLLFISIVCFVLGLVSPNIFKRYFKKGANRKLTSLVFGIAIVICLVVISFLAKGTPILDKIDSKTNQDIIQISGKNAFGNSSVEIMVNDKLNNSVQSDNKGNFSGTIRLEEGMNKIKAKVTNNKAETKTSSEIKISYFLLQAEAPKKADIPPNTPDQTETLINPPAENKAVIQRNDIVTMFPELTFLKKSPVEGKENYLAQSPNKLVVIQIVGSDAAPEDITITTMFSADSANQSKTNSEYKDKLINKLTPNLGMFPDITKEKDSKTVDGFNVVFVTTSLGSGVFSESYSFKPIK